MPNSDIAAQLADRIVNEARAKRRDVARGAETPILAGLQFQQFVSGMCAAALEMFGDQRVGQLLQALADKEVETIDPAWRQHNRNRYAAASVDLIITPAP